MFESNKEIPDEISFGFSSYVQLGERPQRALVRPRRCLDEPSVQAIQAIQSDAIFTLR